MTAITNHRSSTTPSDHLRHVLGRRLRVGLAVAALVSASGCGDELATTASRSAAHPVAASTTTSALAITTNSAPVDTTSTPVSVAAATATRPTAPRDELVDVDGVGMHVRCVGGGDTTVVLIAGFETGDDNWGHVEPRIATRARVCSYARPGTGTSEAATSIQTFTTQAAQLHALLAAAGEPAPYLVVGQSFGGAEAVTFASMFADEVAGLVLIDASPPAWPNELCAAADDGSDLAASIRTNCAGWTDPTGNAEHLDVFNSFAEVSGIDSLGSLPMTVITAVQRPFAGLGAGELARLTRAWDLGQQQWGALSTVSQIIPVEDTGHHIEVDRPLVVTEVVLGLLL